MVLCMLHGTADEVVLGVCRVDGKNMTEVGLYVIPWPPSPNWATLPTHTSYFTLAFIAMTSPGWSRASLASQGQGGSGAVVYRKENSLIRQPIQQLPRFACLHLMLGHFGTLVGVPPTAQ